MKDEIVRAEGEPFKKDGKEYQDFVVVDSTSQMEVVRRYVKGAGGEWEVDPTEKQRILLTKRAAKTARGVDLVKRVNTLERVVVDLSKKPSCKVDFRGILAIVVYAFDISGSMDHLYTQRGGISVMQKVVDRTVPFGIHFDDNGSIDALAFNTKAIWLPEITLDNYADYVEQEIVRGPGIGGGTKYAPVFKAVYDRYVTKRDKNKKQLPVFLMFQTDGDNVDKAESEDWIIKLAAENVFVQFIPTGYEEFPFIERLDDLDGRACDNTGKTVVTDFQAMSDDVLYESLMHDFVPWLGIYPEATKAWKANPPKKRKKVFGWF